MGHVLAKHFSFPATRLALAQEPLSSGLVPAAAADPDHPKIMTLTTLADVQALLRHLQEHHRHRPTWRHVAGKLEEAASGGDQKGIGMALVLALTLEGIEWHPKSNGAAPRRAGRSNYRTD